MISIHQKSLLGVFRLALFPSFLPSKVCFSWLSVLSHWFGYSGAEISVKLFQIEIIRTIYLSTTSLISSLKTVINEVNILFCLEIVSKAFQTCVSEWDIWILELIEKIRKYMKPLIYLSDKIPQNMRIRWWVFNPNC